MESTQQKFPNGITQEVTVGLITLDKSYKADYQKPKTKTAQIRQVVKTVSHYPNTKVQSSLQNNLFEDNEFNFESNDYINEESRVAWINVPENISDEEVLKRLVVANANKAVIYKVLANKPILDENQKYAIAAGQKTMDDFANKQALRYPENERTIENGTANMLILDKKGNVQYRRTFFWGSPMEDVDARNSEDVYLSQELKAELAGASILAGQTI